MAGAFTTLAVCLLFLVPLLLPPEVQEEWRERSHGCGSILVNSESCRFVSEHDTQDSVEKRENMETYGSESLTRGSSAASILEQRLTTPNLVPSKHCVLGKDIWVLLNTSRETQV